MKSVRFGLKVIGRDASDDCTIAFSSRLAHDFLRDFANTVGIQELHPLSIQYAFEDAAQESVEELVAQGVAALLTLLYDRAIRNAGDLDGRQLVPQFQTKPRRKFGSDIRRSAAAFAIDCNDPDH
jgi:hypothetical protein